MKKLRLILLILALLLCGCDALNGGTVPSATATEAAVESAAPPATTAPESIDLDGIPAYSDSPYVVINSNEPFFTSEDYTTVSFESYSDLDSLGRCGVAFACIGVDIMPTEERGSIGQVKPSGWQTVRYDNVDGQYLYNRCHLIGFQLSGENANEKNLITGTRYLNVQGMLPFENMIADYVKETENHVLYRVTPIFLGDNLVASGVLMEALSMEDDDICFNVYCYNVQPDIEIDYLTGQSTLAPVSQTDETQLTFVLNTNSKKFHLPSCSSVSSISQSNKQDYTGSRESLILQGYEPCKSCNP
ncbi:MAG: DNA/RNA non-specific endonuclease [Clostridia bacterium]|nr:DNA/RNA non-specific endonuclease [Clostridia bacterium]